MLKKENKNYFVEILSPDDCGKWARRNFLEFVYQPRPGESECFAKSAACVKIGKIKEGTICEESNNIKITR